MSSERWQSVRVLVESAALMAPPERDAFLDTATSDPDIRAEVEELLSFLAQPTGAFAVRSVSDQVLAFDSETNLTGSLAGNYRLLTELGRGGMGAVYLAERSDGLYEHRVALKVLQQGIASPGLAQRFSEERQILARLSHPGIARLLDGGVTPDGRPFLVLEYVDGPTIDIYCRQHNLDTPSILRLFLKVAEAVQSAHQHFVLHLDLKPANILVTAEGEPRLLDFGIARILSDELTRTNGAEATMRLMTPRYASPEQAGGGALGVPSDVFSLATLLYRLLTGRLPYTLDDANAVETARLIREAPPLAPSEAAPPHLKARLRGDLDTILLQALRKEPERRYPTVAAFAADVQRHLDSKPVQAHADTLTYRAQKFLGRNRVAAPITAVALLLLAISVGVSIRSAIKARRAEAAAERRLQQAKGLAHSYVFDLDTMLEEIPGTIAVRHFVLENAQKYLEAMSKETADDELLAHEIVEGYSQIGRVQATPGLPSMSDWKAASISKANAVAIERRLVARHPEDLDERGTLVRQLISQAQIPDFLGQVTEREQAYNESWQVGQPILAAGPKAKRYLNLSVVTWSIAMLHAGNGDSWNFANPLAAAPWLDRTEQIARAYQQAHPEKPNDSTTRGMLQRVAITRATMLSRSNDLAGARRYYEEALRLTAPQGSGLFEDETRKQFLGLLSAYLLEMNDVDAAEAAAPGPQVNSVHEKVHDRQLTGDEADELILHARIDLRRGRLAAGREKMTQGLQQLEALHAAMREDASLSSQLAWDCFFLAGEPALDVETRKRLYSRAAEIAAWFAQQQPRALSTSMLIGRCELGLAALARADHDAAARQQHAARAATRFSKVLATYPTQPEATALLSQAKQLGPV